MESIFIFVIFHRHKSINKSHSLQYLKRGILHKKGLPNASLPFLFPDDAGLFFRHLVRYSVHRIDLQNGTHEQRNDPVVMDITHVNSQQIYA